MVRNRKISFANVDPIDPRAITIMGVSAKTGDSPIGYFGTGLKYAIATLLRHQHEVRIWISGTEHKFTTHPAFIREQEFDLIYMNGQPLGWTTALGRNWQLWQAFREIQSNLLDEQGESGEREFAPQDWGTLIEVIGEGFAGEWDSRGKTFLEGTPIFETRGVKIFPDAASTIYYRGVRAGDIPKKSTLTYSIIEQTALTEDRTFGSMWGVNWEIARALRTFDREDLLERALASQDVYESELIFSNGGEAPSEAFMRVCERNKENAHFNQSALLVWEHWAGEAAVQGQDCQLDSFEQGQLERAQKLLARLDVTIARSAFRVVPSLGNGVLGKFHKGEIVIARQVFDQGYRIIASTLYEEWLHKEQHEHDMTRSLQNVLFDKLFAMVDRLVELETKDASHAPRD